MFCRDQTSSSDFLVAGILILAFTYDIETGPSKIAPKAGVPIVAGGAGY